MGYLHILTLNKSQDILLFKEVYALEKVHGTSAHISWNATHTEARGESGDITYASGGAKATTFRALFDESALQTAFKALGHDKVTVYGEAYGGGGSAGQGMSDTYGKELRFIVFDVLIGDDNDAAPNTSVSNGGGWLAVPEAVAVATALGLEFVPYQKIGATLEEFDYMRELPSEVAVRRGCGFDKKREGVVLRPLVEMIGSYGQRVIAKHRIEEFNERATPQKIVTAESLKALEDANAIAIEWVTPNRLTHVLDKLRAKETAPGEVGGPLDKSDTRDVIAAMVEDVYREAKGPDGKSEIVESKDAETAIGRRAAMLFHARLAEGGGVT